MTGKQKANPRVSNGNARRKIRQRLKAEQRGCWICRAFGRNDYIDYSLPAGHPLAFECDELIPTSYGGTPQERNRLALDYDNVDAAHRACNQWRGNKSVNQVLEIAANERFGKNNGGNRRGNKAKPTILEQPIDW